MSPTTIEDVAPTCGFPSAVCRRAPAPITRRSTLRRARTALVSSFPSDCHTWNLVFLELLLTEHGYEVVNLGSCVPREHLVEQCLHHLPDIVVLSSVNGHGHLEAQDAIRGIRAQPALDDVVVVVGGKLGVRGAANTQFTDRLLEAGFDAVFTDTASPEAFTAYLGGVATSRARQLVVADDTSCD